MEEIMAQDDIARLYTFTPNTTAMAGEVNDELNQLIQTMNNKGGRGVDNNWNGTNIFQGAGSFTAGLTANTLTVTGEGTIDGLLIEGGIIPAYTFPGWYTGLVPTWVDTDTITISPGAWVDSTGAKVFKVDTPLELKFSNSNGPLGLDTGSKANSTFYTVILWGDSTGANPPTAVLSASFTGSKPAVSGYDLSLRLDVGLRINGIGNLIVFDWLSWGPNKTVIHYPIASGDNADYRIVNAATGTSWSTAGTTVIVPPFARRIFCATSMTLSSATTTLGYLRPGWSSGDGLEAVRGNSSFISRQNFFPLSLNSSGQFGWRTNNTNNGMTVWVNGYAVTDKEL